MKKAKIDILDVADSLEAVRDDEPIQAGPVSAEPDFDLHAPSFISEKNVDEVPKKKSIITWKTLLFFGVPALCLIFVAAAVIAYFLLTDKKSASAPARAVQERMPAAATAGPVSFDNLAAVVQDLSGRQRLVTFGISVTPARGGGVPNLKGDDREVRMASSRIVSGMLFPELLSDMGREQVKKKIKAHIEGIHGPGTVEHVWITSWIIL